MHRLLQRQIARHLDPSQPVPPHLQALIGAVDAAYEQADIDRILLERSMELSSRELLERNGALTTTNAELAHTEERLGGMVSLLRSTLEATADGILVVSLEGKVLDCNRKFVQMWRLPMELVETRDDNALLSFVLNQLKNPDAFVAKVRQLYAQPEANSLDVLEFKDGRVFERSGQPQRQGDVCVGRVWCFRDVTEIRLAAAALRKAKDAAESANHAKSEFLANMSHEIRTPMTAILGFADLLLDPAQTPAMRSDCIETIRRNGKHLLTILNDILDLSKIEAGQMRMEQICCSPWNVVNDVVALMHGRATSKGLALRIEQDGLPPPIIATDPTRLRQILINLVGNAIKFTELGEVRVIVRHVPGAEPRLIISVVDTGMGMTPQQQSALFKPFAQADSSMTRNFGGTGLGLAISQRLAQMLGGDVSMKSELGRGSTFAVTIAAHVPGPQVAEPTAPAMSPAMEAEALADLDAAVVGAKRQTALRGLRVLLAEDGPDNQRLLAFHLKRAGADLMVVENGKEAMDQALAAQTAGRPFDLILMDMQMPVMDGYAATRQLRESGYERPIVALTAHVMESHRQQCMEAGCDEFLPKPIDHELLVATVARVARQPARCRLSDTLPQRKSA